MYKRQHEDGVTTVTNRLETTRIYADKIWNLSLIHIWVDNNDEMSIRPGTAEMVPVLRFSLEGNGSFTELTADNMATLGLTQMPEVSITENGIGRWNVQIPQLPSKVTYYDAYGDATVYDDIQWEVVPAAANGYQLTEVTREDIGSGESIYTGLTEPGWYYVLMEDIVCLLYTSRCV